MPSEKRVPCSLSYLARENTPLMHSWGLMLIKTSFVSSLCPDPTLETMSSWSMDIPLLHLFCKYTPQVTLHSTHLATPHIFDCPIDSRSMIHCLACEIVLSPICQLKSRHRGDHRLSIRLLTCTFCGVLCSLIVTEHTLISNRA